MNAYEYSYIRSFTAMSFSAPRSAGDDAKHMMFYPTNTYEDIHITPG